MTRSTTGPPSGPPPKEFIRLLASIEQEVGRRLTPAEIQDVLSRLQSAGQPAAPEKRVGFLRRVRNTLLELLLAAWLPLIWGIVYLVQWAWPGVSSVLEERPGLLLAAVGAFPVSLVVLFFSNIDDPTGSRADPWYIWVIKGTNNKVRDANVREAYEHVHGAEAWESRLRMIGRARWVFGLAAPGIVPLLLAGRDAWTDPVVVVGSLLLGAIVFMLVRRMTAAWGTMFDTGSTLRDLERSPMGQHPLLMMALLIGGLISLIAATVASLVLTIKLAGANELNAAFAGVGRVALLVYVVFLILAALFGAMGALERSKD